MFLLKTKHVDFIDKRRMYGSSDNKHDIKPVLEYKMLYKISTMDYKIICTIRDHNFLLVT